MRVSCRKLLIQLPFTIFFIRSFACHYWLALYYFIMGCFHYFYDKAFFCALLNSFVHVIMYTYYLLSAMGPKVQRYLWWKRYLTQLQIVRWTDIALQYWNNFQWFPQVQFVLIILHVTVGLYNQCNFPRFLTYSVVIYCLTLIALFSNFYVQSYLRRCRSQVQQRESRDSELLPSKSHLKEN